jgi:hypothetical protein
MRARTLRELSQITRFFAVDLLDRRKIFADLLI